MSGLLEGVNLRTQLVGRNRLELLLFLLKGNQAYGINVFKVQEVIQRPALTRVPNAHPIVCGVATLRGKTIPIIDLAMAIGQPPLVDMPSGIVIVTEYNRSIQGFLVRAVDRIVNINWEDVVPPPEGTGIEHFLTAIAHVDEKMIEMIDVEKVLSNVIGQVLEVPEEVVARHSHDEMHDHLVLIVDDSSIARNQVKRTIEKMGMETRLCKNGNEAFEVLKDWADKDDPAFKRLVMVISDIEMPEMDGYTLTSKIRAHDKLSDLYVMLHTSLSGVFNTDMVQKVAANAFVPKFNANDLSRAVMVRIDDVMQKRH